MIHSNIAPARRGLLERLEATANDFWNISPENGDFLHWLIRSMKARRIVEAGSSNGYSAIVMGDAIEALGGNLISLEKDPGRAALARKHIEEAGLSSVAEVREGDAIQLLTELSGEWDLAFLDAEKSEYRRYAEAILPKIREGGAIVADDTRSLRHAMPDFIEWAYATPGIESIDLSVDDGLVLCRKRG